MPAPLDDIEWLIRSANRVRVLELLADRPHTRSELEDELDVTRITVNRMLEDFETREMVRAEGGTTAPLTITSGGRLIADDLSQLRRTATTARKIRDIQRFLPAEEIDFDLRRLGEATITRSTRSDYIAPTRREVQLMKSCTDRFLVLCTHVDQLASQAIADLLQNTRRFEGICTPDVLETIRSSEEMRRDFIEYIEAGGDLFSHDYEFPVRLSINDGTVGLSLNDKSGFVPAFIETDDDHVLKWAERTYERHRERSKRLDLDDLDRNAR